MICSKCGAQNMDGVTFCGSCGTRMETPSQTQENPQAPSSVGGQQPVRTQPMSSAPLNGGMVMPKDYMIESIIVTIISFLCCCSPVSVILGIIAIIKANNVKTEFECGNLSEAITHSESAKKLTIWAVIVAVVWYIISTIISFVFLMPIYKESLDQMLNNM